MSIVPFLSYLGFLGKIEFIRNGNSIEQVEFIYQTERQDFGNSSYKSLDEIVVRKNWGSVWTSFTLQNDYFLTSSGSDKRLKLESIQQVGMPPYIFEYEENLSMPDRGSFAQDHWGYYNGKHNNPSLVPHFEDLTGTGDRSVDETKIGAWTLNKIYWPTGGNTVFDMEGYNGGLRVKSIYDYDGMGEMSNYRNFEYEKVSFGSHSYHDGFEKYLEGDGSIPSCSWVAVSSGYTNPVTFLHGVEGPDVGFKKVTINYQQDEEQGKTVVEFSTSFNDLGPDHIYWSLGAIRWGMGKVLQETHYNAAGNPLSRTKNLYKVHHAGNMWSANSEANEKFIYGLDIRKTRPQ